MIGPLFLIWGDAVPAQVGLELFVMLLGLAVSLAFVMGVGQGNR